jgi:S-methylmethionine-dependent homocysteine/selenocysteine methylase
LAVETIPALKEARAVLKLLHTEAPNVPTWISFSCQVKLNHSIIHHRIDADLLLRLGFLQDGSRLCHGEDFSAAAKDIWAAKTKGLIAIGINCTEGKYIGPLLASLSAGDSIPLVLYPNFADGEIIKGDLGLRESLDVLAAKWLNVHSNIFAIGGCCGYFPTDISTLRASVFNGYLVHNSSMNPII